MTNEKENVVLEEEPTKTAETKEEAKTAEDTTETVEEPTDEVVDDEEELSPWYYFFSVGCGFCKKVEPIVEELNKEGHDILMLDMTEPDNQALNKELQQEYGKRCGTPWFINADTGEHVCGYREKAVLEKWLAGESIPEPPKLKSQMPKIPFMGSSKEEEKTWTDGYNKWLEDNNHMGDDFINRQRTAKDILESPRPKSDPPRPPMGMQLVNSTDEALDSWGEHMTKWQEENSHLPNLQPVAGMVQNMKNRRTQMQQQQQTQASGVAAGGSVDNSKINTLEAKVTALEVKIDKIMSHFGIK
tara:strand:+ start:287 stop:1189 length:903 start_codon:yes stop_codon:yes gene_type:complete